MNQEKFIENIKMMEIARYFIKYHNYRELHVKDVEGLFIENKENTAFSLIKISSKKFASIQEFNEEMGLLKKLVQDYSEMMQKSDVKCLVIYFDGVVERERDNIFSIVLNDNNAILNDDIISKYFPTMKEHLNLKQLENVVLPNFETNKANKTKTSEINISDLFATSDNIRKIKFGFYFPLALLLVNLIFLFQFSHLSYDFDFSFYAPFYFQLDQVYRLFTAVFINESIFTTFIVCYFFLSFTPYIELKLGTTKTIFVFITGIIAIFFSMLFLSGGRVFQGSYPLLGVLAGGYIGVALLPSNRAFIQSNILRASVLILGLIFYPLLLAGSNSLISADYVSAILAFLTSLGMVFALGLKEQKINLQRVIIVNGLIVLVGLTSLIPNQSLKRNSLFESKYLNIIAYRDKARSKELKRELEDYYTSIGVVEYD